MSPTVLASARRTWLALALLAAPSTAGAHPAPFSYLDLALRSGGADGALVVHVIDVAHDLEIEPPDRLLDPAIVQQHRRRICDLVAARLVILMDGAARSIDWARVDALRDRRALRLTFTVASAPPGVVTVEADLFPYDPNHVTFLNVYEWGELRHQAAFDRGHRSHEYFPGTRQGRVALVSRFLTSGVHHIAIGPDHILFLVGLLLMGGRFLQLVKVVTAFTLAHSVTLSVAALDVYSPPAAVVEPAIALSIVYVGADNLLVVREAGKGSRDIRPWIAFGFGLVHGFGFANVLREMDLPQQALGWTLFSFNLGVEVGQLVVVFAVASVLAVIRRWNQDIGRRLVVGGSLIILAAGAYWFVMRTFGEF